MPKSKKKKNQDFQKVKLKVGKRLPKGDNVTNLSFKTRQIQLTQRIKGDESQGLVTKKKQNAQDLLRQCDHHSTNSRLSAVMGLRELWINNSVDLMVPTNVHGYSAILKRLSGLLIDNEAPVRHAVINLFKLILHKITKDTSQKLLGGSLYAHIHTFLCCAMNHVHEDVRLDALLLYDALLETSPELVVQHASSLLLSLMGLLASLSQGQVGPRGNTTVQKLSLNPESRLPVAVFRVRVLTRIKQTLMACQEHSFSPLMSTKDALGKQLVWSVHNDYYSSKRKLSTLIFPRQMQHRFSILSGGNSDEMDDPKTSSLESFTEQSLPVLIQLWKETLADTEAEQEAVSILSCETLEVISLLVSVIRLIFLLCIQSDTQESLVQNEAISSKCFAQLEQLMMAGFPYSVQPRASGSKKKNKRKKDQDSILQTDESAKVSLSALNSNICDIMSIFCANFNMKLSNKRRKKMSHHTIIMIRETPGVDKCRTIIRIIKSIFLNPDTADSFAKVYKMALNWYLKLKPKAHQKRLLFDLFAVIGCAWDGWTHNQSDILSVNHYQTNEDIEETLTEFFRSLPQLSLAVHSLGDENWTLAVLKLLCHGHVHLCGISFDQLLDQLLDPVEGIFSSANEQIQQQACHVLSRGTHFSKENLKQLLSLLRNPPDKPVICGRKSWSCASHVLYAMFLNIRACVPLSSQKEFNEMSKDQHEQLSDFLRFLFSILIGFTGEELDHMCPKVVGTKSKTSLFHVDFSMQDAQWQRHIELCNIVAREIASFILPPEPQNNHKNSFTFISNFEHFWTQTFHHRRRMHVLSALGLSIFMVQASQTVRVEKPGEDLTTLAAATIASVLADLYEPDTVSQVPSSLTWQIKDQLTSVLNSLSTVGSSVSAQLMEILANKAKGDADGSDVERQAAKSAQDFLLTDENLKQRLQSEES